MVFEDVVGQNALANYSVGYEVDNLWGGRQPAACIFEIVCDVKFGVEIGGERRCASCSSQYGYSEVSASYLCYNSHWSRRWNLRAIFQRLFNSGLL
jgi:hypothetical protein